MYAVLIVEDDRSISELIRINLRDADYFCECVYDGMAAADALERKRFDLVLLDIMLPEVDGYELLEYIKPLDIPVIFLTAKTSVKDKVKGLKLGAEDYITKPFEIEELLVRMETILRRCHKKESILEFRDVKVNTQSRIVTKVETELHLTQKEYELLLLFLQNKNIVLFRDRIYEKVWREEYYGNSRTVELHVQRLRKKLGWEECLTTVYKIGYRLEEK